MSTLRPDAVPVRPLAHTPAVVPPSEAGSIAALLTRAFHDDPPSRWLWPDDAVFAAAFPRFALAFGGEAFPVGCAERVGSRGAALWLPPGATPDDEDVARIIEETVPSDRVPTAMRIFEEMSGFHPSEPVCHLPLIGVEPAFRGAGIGSALLRRGLDACDRQRLPVYLEATSERNEAFYRRHGFEPIGRIRCGDAPPIVPMLRRPR